MSHYAVAVFCDSPDDTSFDELLRPYNEADEAYFVFEPVSQDEINARWMKFHEQNPNWKRSEWQKEFYTERDGKFGHWHNPNAKWDWYTLDGRDFAFDEKPEVSKALDAGTLDFHGRFLKSQLDWEKADDQPSDAECRSCWRRYVAEGDGFYNAEYYKRRYGTEDQYVKEMMQPTIPYCFVTPDGKWHSPGEVGWFGYSDESADTWNSYADEWFDFIRNAPDCYVSLVDCHI